MSRLKAMLFGDSQEYSEPAMALRASLYMAPLWLLGWDHWARALVVWLVASVMAYRYGYWVRDDV